MDSDSVLSDYGGNGGGTMTAQTSLFDKEVNDE